MTPELGVSEYHPLLPDNVHACMHTLTHTQHTHLVLCILSFSRLSCSYIIGIIIPARSSRRVGCLWIRILLFLELLIIIRLISCVLEGNGNAMWWQVHIWVRQLLFPHLVFPSIPVLCPNPWGWQASDLWPSHTLRLESKRLKVTSHAASSILWHERQMRVGRGEIIPLFLCWVSRSLMASWALRNLNGNCRLWITDFWKAREGSWVCGALGASVTRKTR